MRRSSTSFALLFALGAGTVLTGCSAGSSPSVGPNGQAQALSFARATTNPQARGVRLPPGAFPPALVQRLAEPGWLATDAKAGKSLVYVADQSSDAIEIYDQQGQNQAPVGRITQGLYGVSGLFVDSGRRLYATNFGNGTVAVYPPGKTAPSETLTGAGSPTFVVVAPGGTVYVSNYNSNSNGTVLAYTKGHTKPSKTIVTLGSNEFPEGLALDSHGNLYVAYNTTDGEVLEFTAKNPMGVNLGIHVGYVGGLTIDTSDRLLLVDQNLPGVDVFPQGATKPTQQITGFSLAYQLALDKKNDALFVTSPSQPGKVSRVSYPAGTIDDVITSGLNSAYGVATSPDGSP